MFNFSAVVENHGEDITKLSNVHRICTGVEDRRG